MSEIDNFYLNQSEPNQSCLLALREIILKVDESVSETKKYGMPCFCFKNKAFCYLWIDKKSALPYILFVEGRHLSHQQLEKGDRKRMKTLTVNPNKDVPIDLISTLLSEAVSLYKSGKVKLKN